MPDHECLAGYVCVGYTPHGERFSIAACVEICGCPLKDRFDSGVGNSPALVAVGHGDSECLYDDNGHGRGHLVAEHGNRCYIGASDSDEHDGTMDWWFELPDMGLDFVFPRFWMPERPTARAVRPWGGTGEPWKERAVNFVRVHPFQVSQES